MGDKWVGRFLLLFVILFIIVYGYFALRFGVALFGNFFVEGYNTISNLLGNLINRMGHSESQFLKRLVGFLLVITVGGYLYSRKKK